MAFALAAKRSGAPLHEVLLAFAFGWAENLLQAAIKTVPLGQRARQRRLSALDDTIPAVLDRAPNAR